MNAAIGFTALSLGTPVNKEAITASQSKALAHFEDIDQLVVSVGDTDLWLWGRGDLADYFTYLPDGSLLALIGSPLGNFSWIQVQENLAEALQASEFKLPWEGRVILLRIDPKGDLWTIWNDWLGSIPIFYSTMGDRRIASTLEPVVVSTAGLNSEDIFVPALISLLSHGHFLGNWTMFEKMKVVPADCVAEWDVNGFRYKQIYSVRPTEARWEVGWDELVEEMHDLSHQAIVNALSTQKNWILPLSSGLDSRLIAAVAAETGVNMDTYTWGARNSRDVVYSRKIARALSLRWKWIDLGTNYLYKYTNLWADLFGSSMHFHGMYQMTFMDELRSEPNGSIMSGFLGEALAGGHIQPLARARANKDRFQLMPDDYIYWLTFEINLLFKIPIDNAMEQVALEIERQMNDEPGTMFQRLMFLDFWNRQRFFIYFHPLLCDYWRGVATPYLNKEYARFCLSLPRLALDRRQLQVEVYRRFYGVLARIPGSYAEEPFIYTGRYLTKRRIARSMPRYFIRGPLREFNSTTQTMLSLDGECVKNTGTSSLWPIFNVWDRLEEWFNMPQIEAEIRQARNGNLKSVRRLQSIQAFAYRLLDI